MTSLKISHPKKIVNIGVKKEKLATPDAGYFDSNHNQNKKPPNIDTPMNIPVHSIICLCLSFCSSIIS